jgi:predicted nucleic acid-binding protein
MRAVDTSAWIEFLAKGQAYEPIKQALPETSRWLVPTIVQLELEKWCCRNRDDDYAAEVLAFANSCVLVPLTTEIAISAARICIEHKLATADAIIYATARAYVADLLTCDAHFRGLPGVTLVPNGKS